MLKIAIYTAVDANLSIFSNAYDQLKSSDLKLQVFHRRSFASLNTRKALMEYLKEADILIVQLMGVKESMPGFDEILGSNHKAKVFIYGTTPTIIELSEKHNTLEDKIAKELFYYFAYGGVKNMVEMFNCLRHHLEDKSLNYKGATQIPMCGIFHPKHGYFETYDAYDPYIQKEKMTIGITFYRNYYLNDDHQFLDDLVESLEKKNLNVLIIFVSTVKSDEITNNSVTESLKKFMVSPDGHCRVDTLINLLMFSNNVLNPVGKLYLDALDVPVLQGLLITENYETWQKENHGLTPAVVTINVALPEMDGTIIAVAIATKELSHNKATGLDVISYVSIKDRIEKLSSMALNYAYLKNKKNADKKIAILMHNYPPKNQAIGCAFGLDTQKSIINILKALKKDGYKVDEIYDDSHQFMTKILSVATNDEDWVSNKEKNDSLLLTKEKYQMFFDALPIKVQNSMTTQWGSSPGLLMKFEKNKKENLLIPGLENGHIFIGIQPKRTEDMDATTAYHNPDLAMNHHYYAYYQWLKHEFKADAVIHVGKHGSLEWLPGKAIAMSETCQAGLAIDDLPNFYPYIINNPAEGTQAKRRSHATLIGHMEPAMAEAEIYDDFSELENLMDELTSDKSFGRLVSQEMLDHLNQLMDKTGLSLDFGLIKDANEDLKAVHNYLESMKETLINNGLHVLGEAPTGEALIKFVCALTRLTSPGIDSLEETMAKAIHVNLIKIHEDRNKGTLLEKQKSAGLLRKVRKCSYEFVEILIKNSSLKEFYKRHKVKDIMALDTLEKDIRQTLLRNVLKTEDEIKNLMYGLKGKFVAQGPSGAPTRGQSNILPTGRNFYSVNPNVLPTRLAWATGVKLGDALLLSYLNENDQKYPENIGFVLFASPTIRTKGEDIAQIMYLMGVKPKWEKGSNLVRGFEIIPTEILGRPRIDLTLRITGFFRDAFMNIVEILDACVQKIASLEETEANNYIMKHVLADMKDSNFQNNDPKTFRESTYRIFGAKPGAYGTGVNTLINGKDWQRKEDISKMYLEYGGYVYGQKTQGFKKTALLKKQLSKIDFAIKNIDTKETDVLANDDNYAYLGGMVATASSLQDKKVTGYVGDSSDPRRVKVKDIQEETRFVLRTKVLNPNWYKNLKQHGFRGATEISSAVDYMFGWDATTDVIDDLSYEKVIEAFIKNEEMSQWMKNANPWASQNIIERMLEAIQRGLFKASDEMKNYLVHEHLKNEATLESKSTNHE